MKNVMIFALAMFILWIVVTLICGANVPTQDFSQVQPAANSFQTFFAAFGL